MSIVKIEASELPQTFGLARNLVEEMSPDKSFDEKSFVSLWRRMLSDDNGVMFGLFSPQSHLGGVIGGIVASHQLTGEKVAYEMIWYVDKEHRRQRKGLGLLSAFQIWAKRREAKQVMIGQHNNLLGKGLKGYFKEQGYRKYNTAYVKEI